MPIPAEKKKPERIVDPEAAMVAWNAIDFLLQQTEAHGISPEMVYRVGRVMAQLLTEHQQEARALLRHQERKAGKELGR
jgi:pyrroloquinoline quinone (PQQ) biosynthesis protein C